MLTKSVINVDWLQLNCRCKNNGFFQYDTPYKEFKVVQTDIHTRQWQIVDEVFLNDRRIATIVRQPASSIIDAKTILIKFDNYFLYNHRLQDAVNFTLDALGLVAINITRFDVAMDFQNFVNNLKPQKLIEKFLVNEYLKIGKGKGSLIFNFNYNVTKEYVRFGSNTSNLCYYLYNKTTELNEVKKKPWIEDCWRANGFDMDKPTWRLEFSIKTGNANLFERSTGEVSVLKESKFLEPSYYKDLYNTLLKKYFTFYFNNGSGKKCRMDKVDLFGEIDVTRELQFITRKLETNRADKIYLNKMNSVFDELRDIAKDAELMQSQKKLMQHFIKNRNLQKYADRKGIVHE